jgi:hypothetical protein
MVEMLATSTLFLGVLGIVAEVLNFFPGRGGVTGIMGAMLFSAAIIALAIIEVNRARWQAPRPTSPGPTDPT